MFDTWKHLDLLQKKLDSKNMLSSGRKLFETDIDNLNVKVIVGHNNTLKSQKHIHENRFYIANTEEYYENKGSKEYTFADFVKYLQEEDKFDEFKWRIEEKLLGDV
jgi:hypothetical protein